jgi:hypothetical protein
MSLDGKIALLGLMLWGLGWILMSVGSFIDGDPMPCDGLLAVITINPGGPVVLKRNLICKAGVFLVGLGLATFVAVIFWALFR